MSTFLISTSRFCRTFISTEVAMEVRREEPQDLLDVALPIYIHIQIDTYMGYISKSIDCLCRSELQNNTQCNESPHLPLRLKSSSSARWTMDCFFICTAACIAWRRSGLGGPSTRRGWMQTLTLLRISDALPVVRLPQGICVL